MDALFGESSEGGVGDASGDETDGLITGRHRSASPSRYRGPPVAGSSADVESAFLAEDDADDDDDGKSPEVRKPHGAGTRGQSMAGFVGWFRGLASRGDAAKTQNYSSLGQRED